MRKLFGCFLGLLLLAVPVKAQDLQELPLASEAAEIATNSSQATPSGIVEVKLEQKQDLTQPQGEGKNKLEQLLIEHPAGELKGSNFLRYTIERAVKNGLPINTVVLILLFPLIVMIVAASRHLIGIRGVGILTPALLSVGFLATGIWAGVGLFVVILLLATSSRILLKRLKLQYLPRMSLLLWFVSAGVLGVLFLAANFNIQGLVSVGIFPILILMSLAETFIDIQVGRSAGEAKEIIFQTFVLAMISSLILAWEEVQKAVLLYPEAIFLGVAAIDLLLGRYTGLRLTEYLMFKRVTDEEEE